MAVLFPVFMHPARNGKCIRHILTHRGLSSDAIKLLESCRAEGTLTGTFYKWRVWPRLAKNVGCCNFDFNSSQGIMFLTALAVDPKTGAGPAKQLRDTFALSAKFLVLFPKNIK